MATRETLGQFAKNLNRFSPVIQGLALRDWNRNTRNVLSEAQRKAPVAAGELVRSGGTIKATITPTGIESFVEFKQPYAEKLNDPNANIRLKDPGELSYIAGGQRVTKKKKGELGYLDKAIKELSNDFTGDLERIISTSFDKI